MAEHANVHEDFRRDDVVTGSSNRSFGFVFTAFFLVVGLLPLIHEGGAVRWWSIGVAAVFLAVSLIKPDLLAPLNWIWTKIGLLLHMIVNPIVMGLIFVCAIVPIGLIFRMTGKDPLRLRLDKGASTYWIMRDPPGPPPESMSNQF